MEYSYFSYYTIVGSVLISNSPGSDTIFMAADYGYRTPHTSKRLALL